MPASSSGLVALLLLVSGAQGQEIPVPVGQRTLVGPPRLLVEGARTVAWAPKGDWIAFDRPDDAGYSHLYVAEPDGSSQRCLTCDAIGFRKRHAGNPTWHPSGRYLLFQLEKPLRIRGHPVPFLSVPGRNLGDDIWAITFDGRRFWNLTNRSERGGRVLSPRFSHEGDRVVWSERVAGSGAIWGRWVLRVARFDSRRGVPRLRGVRTYKPGLQRFFYESYGFTGDDRGILFAANLDPGQSEGGLDLYVLRLESGELQRLTSSVEELDRFAGFSPSGRKIVWASSRDIRDRRIGFERHDPSAAAPLDLWMMNGDGSGLERLTRFNDVFSDQYTGRVMVGSASWSRKGDRLIVPVTPLAGSAGGGLYLLELDEAYGD